MRIIVDTMVFISGANVSTSYSSQVMQLWEKKSFEIAASEPILSELKRVMSYPDIQRILPLTGAQIDQYIEKIRRGAYMVPGTTLVRVSPDPDDNKFFACAIEAGADYIVSKDKKHILSIGSYHGVQTIMPQDFIENVVRFEKVA